VSSTAPTQRHRSVVMVVTAAALALLLPVTARGQSATERISISSGGEQANAIGDWWYLAPNVAFSATGALVAFSSDATNLVARDRNRASDVFVRNRARGVTVRVSLTASGKEANGFSFGPSLSRDGAVVAFLSEATNLAGARHLQPGRHVFVRAGGSTERVDVSSSGKPGRGTAWGPPVVSGDGRYVAFTTDAPDLVRGDRNRQPDVFVHDRRTRQTTRVSVGADGRPTTGSSVVSAMSPDGRFVLFTSESEGLAPGAVGDRSHVFLRDRVAGTTRWIGQSGADIFDGSRGAISDDAGVVAFEGPVPGFGVLLWTAAAGAARCISCWDGVTPAPWNHLSGMSADGRKVAFTRIIYRDPAGDDSQNEVFVHDVATGVNELLSVAPGGAAANGSSRVGGMSADGRFAGFSSDATNLVPGDTNRRTDLFVRGPL
jgi:hypothetical protein